jgi:hypothetical protein
MPDSKSQVRSRRREWSQGNECLSFILKSAGDRPNTDVSRASGQQYFGTSTGSCASSKNIVQDHDPATGDMLAKILSESILHIF